MLDKLNKLARRILLIMARGTITLVNDTGSVQMLQARLSVLELVPDIPRFAEYGFTSNPPNGTQVVIAFKNGDRNDGIVIATSNAEFRMKALATGEVAISDNRGQSVYLSAAGIVVKGGGLPITLTDTPKVRAETVLFQCTGDIVDNCDTTGRSMAADRVIYDNHDHDVPGIQKGNDTVTSNKPAQTE